MNSRRTFIAIPLPEQLRQSLDLVRQTLDPSSNAVTWVRPELMHITLKFLGDTPERIMHTVGEIFLSTCSKISSFKLKIKKDTGSFPKMGEPRVLWAGLQNIPGELYSLSDELNTAYVALGFDDSGKRFSPHISLARVKEKPHPSLIPAFLDYEFPEEEFWVKRIIWYESCHRKGKLCYLPLEECKLQEYSTKQ